MRREEYEQDATALMGAVDCGTGGRLQHVCGHGEDDAVSPPALLGVRAFRITQRGGKGLWCWGSSSLASSALVSCCGRPSLCNAATRGCVRDAVCPCLHAVLRELGRAVCSPRREWCYPPVTFRRQASVRPPCCRRRDRVPRGADSCTIRYEKFTNQIWFALLFLAGVRRK